MAVQAEPIEVNFCIFCSKSLKATAKYKTCVPCHPKFKLAKSECNPVDVNSKYARDMKYCYNCGTDDELLEDEEEQCKVCMECDMCVKITCKADEKSNRFLQIEKIQVEKSEAVNTNESKTTANIRNISPKLKNASEEKSITMIEEENETEKIKEKNELENTAQQTEDANKLLKNAKAPGDFQKEDNTKGMLGKEDNVENEQKTAKLPESEKEFGNDESRPSSVKVAMEEQNETEETNRRNDDHITPDVRTAATSTPATTTPAETVSGNKEYVENVFEGFTRIPDKEIIKNLADHVQKKWKKIGLALKLNSNHLNKWEGKPFRESFALMLSLWERKGKTYAWSALFKALSAVGEKAAADELIGMLCEFPASDDEETVDEEEENITHDLRQFIVPWKTRNKQLAKSALLTSLAGLTKEKCKQIHFHAIFSSSKWNIDETSKVIIISKSSGDVMCSFVSFKNTTNIEESHLYEATLPIPDTFIQSTKFCYKYAIFHKNELKKEDLCIGGREWRTVNVTQSRIINHYDPVILPPNSVSIVRAYLGSPKDLVINSATDALKFYLAVYLKEWLTVKNLITNEDIKMIEKHILSLLRCLKYQQQYSILSSSIVELNLSSNHFLDKTFLFQLSKATEDFHCIEKLQFALILSCLLKSCDILSLLSQLEIQTTKELLKGFQIPIRHLSSCTHPIENDCGHGHFEDVVSVLRNLEQNTRDCVINAATILCQVVADRDETCEWMKVLPLLHILNNCMNAKFTPCTKKGIDSIIFCSLNVSQYKARMLTIEGFAENSFHSLQPYFDVDWLMPRAWISMISIFDFYRLKDGMYTIAPFACWEIGTYLFEKGSALKQSEINDLSSILLLLLSFINTIDIEKVDYSLCYKGSRHILQYYEIIKEPQYMLLAVEFFLRILKKIHNKDFNLVQNSVESFSKWLRKNYGEYMVSNKVNEELKHWGTLLEINKTVSHFEQQLNLEIHIRMNLRLDLLEPNSKVQIMMNNDVKDQSIRDSVTQSFLKDTKTAAITADTNWFLSFIKKSSVSQETLVVLGGILRSQFTQDEPINLKSIFRKFLPESLDIYVSCIQKGHAFGPDQSDVSYICERALKLLGDFFTSLQSRLIMLEDLDAIADAIAEYDKQTIEEHFTAFLQLKLFEKYVKSLSFEILNQEVVAYEQFKIRRKEVLHMLQKVLEFATDEATKTKEDLTNDLKSYLVKDVWTFDEQTRNPKYSMSSLSIAPESIIKEVFRFTSSEECSSQIFRSRWENTKKKFLHELNGNQTTIENFVTNLWIPVIAEFREDLEAMSNGLKLPLHKVTELFEGLKGRELLERELIIWCSAFNVVSTGWIRNAAKKIMDYQQLSYYSKSAQTLMQLKNTLKLSGDFTILTKLLDEEVVEEVTLASVDVTAATTVAVLKDIAEHPSRRLCLEVFCSCTELVDWIRKMAKNVGMLAELVQVSNQTMEGDMIKQLLSDLLVFGSAFAPLIYEISPTESCESLVNRCKSLWTFLDTHPDLHSIAKLCNERLGEFQRIEEALTDFQKNNVEVMNTINEKGIYSVSAFPGRIHHSTENAINLRLRDMENEDDRRVYSLSDLKDLQSRLVLVAAENAEKVKRFIEVLLKVEQVAELVVKLQESGFIDYTHYSLTFGCSQYKRKEIENHISTLESTLVDWRKTVQNHRKKYPQLNYYTSQQLLDLQKEFGKLKKNPKEKPSCKLMLLLLSVTSNPHPDKISRAIEFISSNSSKVPKRVAPKSVSVITGVSKKKFCLDDLGEREREIYNTLTSVDDYSSFLVLQAFETCAKNTDIDEEELRLWCMDNESKITKEDDDLDVPDDVSTNQQNPEITPDDPDVKELLDEKYKLDIALQAVKLSRTMKISIHEAASSLDLGRSIETKKKTGWAVPTKHTQMPFNVKMEVPRDDYLSLVELGDVLKELACTIGENEVFPKPRSLKRHVIEQGSYNVVMTNEVWKAVLHLYMIDDTLPLPTSEEIIVCTETTTIEEVTLLWHRAVNDKSKYRIFTLVNGEKLPFKICEEVLNNLESITQGSSDFKIVIVINSKDPSKTYISSRLGAYVRHIPSLPPDAEVAAYIMKRTKCDLPEGKGIKLSNEENMILKNLETAVRVVTSNASGMGKSLHIRRHSEILRKEYVMNVENEMNPDYVCIPIHGPEISVENVIEQLQKCGQDPNNPYPQIIHFNIANSIIEKIDWLLFKILILGSLADGYGNIWRRVSTQICMVECTLSKLEDIAPGKWTYTDESAKEIPNTYSLLSLLPQSVCVSPKKVETLSKTSAEEITHNSVLFDETVFKDNGVQRVFQYLRRFESKMSLDNFVYSVPEGKSIECLSTILRIMSSNSPDTFDPSWSEVQNFITFLNAQLCDCEGSVFCNLGDDSLRGFKQFIVRFSIDMAKEFTEPTMNIGRCNADITSSNLEELYSVSKGKTWNECAHPYLLFNQDEGHSMTFMGLWIDQQCNLIHICNEEKKVVESNYMNKQLREALDRNGVKFMEEYNKLGKAGMLQKLIRLLGKYENEFMTNGELDLEKIDPDESYVLTLDNLMKMLAIHLKFKCGIPVIMMGETGCGKTRLLRYLCEVQDKAFETKTLLCLKVHGGTNEDRIFLAVEQAIKLADRNQRKHGNNVYTVLFFDEVNTTEALDLIKEIICDRTLNGKPIPKGVKFAAACNPYRVHDKDTLESLQRAGLGFYLRDEERIPKLGNIPLRKLVYRVLPLPSSMNQYVYDFGTVVGQAEGQYIRKIVINQIKDCRHITDQERNRCENLLFSVLNECQTFMRDQKNECKYVSLRDVVRAMVLFNFFLEKLKTIKTFKDTLISEITDNSAESTAAKELNDIIRALIFSISIGYYARLSDRLYDNDEDDDKTENVAEKVNLRKDFLLRIVPRFPDCQKLTSTEDKVALFENEILRVQNVFLNAMNVPSNIAHNAALRENVFMMAVCIENRLPLFIVGKPGSSKSLAKSIVANSMQGQYSSNRLLTHFKQIQLFPYQCNQFSTTTTLVEVFEEAKAFQKRQKDVKSFASVVVLEEIGLAEDTPGLPLKVLHPYLEDGTAGINPEDEDIKAEERVAFIGISNWALDPAKMNRGIMVTRSSPAQEELLKSAYGIAKMIQNDFIQDELSKSFDGLAEMYRRICEIQEMKKENSSRNDEAREFFGLRDFYTMIKMLCWICIDSGKCPTPSDFRYAILRNFSGHSSIDPLQHLPNASSLISMVKSDDEELNIIQTSLEPIRINDKINDKTSKRDNRYLLLITENQSALGILRTHLLKNETPYIFYGSSFPKDKEYTQVCVNINKIKVCMERGIPVILLNYEQIYESLYDVLNQCYTELHTGRYVDLGLRSYKIKCRVDPNFRLIIIAEKSRVFTQFPTALINRMEKHILVSKTILTAKEKELLTTLEEWSNRFSSISSFVAGDAFVGHQEDTAATILLYSIQKVPDKDDETMILNTAKETYLQIASCDSLARLCSPSSKLNEAEVKHAFDVYFEQQEHFFLPDFLQKCFETGDGYESANLIQITTYGPLLSPNQKLFSEISDVHLYHISEFDTEVDFCGMLSDHFKAEKTEPRLLIIQCEWEEWNTDLIACARHRVQDETINVSSKGITRVIFIIRLFRVNGGSIFTSFQGNPWLCVHFDDLTAPEGINKILSKAFTTPIHAFFQFLIDNDPEIPSIFQACNRIKENVQIALAKTVSYSTFREVESLIGILPGLIDEELAKDTLSFSWCLLLRIQVLLKQKDDDMISPADKWAVDAALDKSKLQTNLTLVNSIKRLLDVQLQKLLSYIISEANVNHNIQLFAASDNTCLKKLWLDLFRKESFFRLNYQTTMVSSTKISIDHQFPSQFPFSWEVIEQINSVLSSLFSLSDDERRNLNDELASVISILESQVFAESINHIPPDISTQFFDFYLNDYLQSLHLPFENFDLAHEILKKAVISISSILEPAIGQKSPFPLLHGIACIHLAYSLMEREVFYFSELCARNPELPSEILESDVVSSGKVIFHILAMSRATHKIYPDRKEWNELSMKKWLHSYHEIRNVVETVLNLQDEYDQQTQQIITSSRLQWQKTQAVVLLAEHVVVNITYTDLFVFLKRYNNLLKNLAFTQPQILTYSLRQIQAIIRELPVKQQPQCEICKDNLKLKNVVYLPCGDNHILCKSCYKNSIEIRGPRCPCCNDPIPRTGNFDMPDTKKKEYEMLRSAQQNCMDFFMEMISQCCFSSLLNSENPSDEFLVELLGIITDTENEEYRQLFPLDEDYSHSCPIARSVLLQELLERSPHKVKEKLQEYQSFIKSQGYISDDSQLTLLCIKSIEDGLHKQCLLKSNLDDKIDIACECLHLAFENVLSRGDVLKEYRATIPIKYMECLAQVRFGLCFASKMFYTYYCSDDALQMLPLSTKVKLEQLHQNVKRIVTEGIIREPRDFLVKQLVRQYGFTYLEILSKKDKFKNWIIETNQGTKSSDEFVVCGSKYLALRSQWCFSSVSLEKYKEELQNNPEVENHVIAYITLFRRLLTISDEFSVPVLLSKIRLEITSIDDFNEEFLHILHGKHCDPILLKNVTFSPWTSQTTMKLSAVIVHFATVISALSAKGIRHFLPFTSILKNIEDLKTSFWPALPDHALDIVMSVQDVDHEMYGGNGSWWECENGHPYFIGDCGNPINPGDERKNMSYTRCNECGVPIGGRDLRKNTKTKLDIRTGYTKPGHWLNPPSRRTTTIPAPERDLSPISHYVMLVLIHSSCVWATTSFNPETYKNLVESIVQDTEVLEQDVFTFFWNHLEKDLEMLCRATQLCFDDCILVLHRIIHNMLQQSTPLPGLKLPLKSRELRQTWEIAFDEAYIQPFTKNIDSSVKEARNLLIDDCSEDHKKLYEMIYEKKNYADGTNKIDPHLWIYRPIITIDHVAQSLQQHKDLMKTKDLQILEEFIKNVDQLAILHYLPDIVQMQSALHEICNHRIDKNEAENINIERFLETYISKEHQRSKLMKEVNSFCNAWNIVREKLPEQTIVYLDKKYAAVEMTLAQPLAYFIPMREGKGICSIALATYLAKLQNDCIEKSWRKLAKSELSAFKVPIQRIQKSQIIHFEEQITSVIFSHCKYSLKAGHGADIVYDFVALEKHILDRFVRGKPLIQIRFPGMLYRSDVIQGETFKSICRKITQSPLAQRDKEDILIAIHFNQCLQECIDIVNVTLGFIQYGRWEPHHMLKRCFAALKLDKKLPKIIEDRCQVKHLISLWRILNVEQSKQLIQGKEDPFGDIKSVFKHDLNHEEQELLKKELQPYDIDQFIEVFYEFIATHVKNRGENEMDDPLTDAYIDVCDYFDLEKIKHFEERFPDEFSLKHVTEIWKYAVGYQEQQSEH